MDKIIDIIWKNVSDTLVECAHKAVAKITKKDAKAAANNDLIAYFKKNITRTGDDLEREWYNNKKIQLSIKHGVSLTDFLTYEELQSCLLDELEKTSFLDEETYKKLERKIDPFCRTRKGSMSIEAVALTAVISLVAAICLALFK